jgi:hypothetical protein
MELIIQRAHPMPPKDALEVGIMWQPKWNNLLNDSPFIRDVPSDELIPSDHPKEK